MENKPIIIRWTRVFTLLLFLSLCTRVYPVFVAGDTFGFSSLLNPSWFSEAEEAESLKTIDSGGATLLQPVQHKYVSDVEEDSTTLSPPTTFRPELKEDTDSVPPATTMTYQYMITNHAADVEIQHDMIKRKDFETNNESKISYFPIFSEERLEAVVSRSIKSAVAVMREELQETKNICSVCGSIGTESTGDNDRDQLSSKIKNQLKDIKTELKITKDLIQQLSASFASVAGFVSGVQPHDCFEIMGRGAAGSGSFYIQPIGVDRPRVVYCDMTTDGGGWTVIQNRNDGTLDFNRGWGSYRRGFGETGREFWIGLDFLYLLTQQDEYEMRIDMVQQDGRTAHAYYSFMWIGGLESSYALHIGVYNGTAGDSLSYHNGLPFTTRDKDNDVAPRYNCGEVYKSGWWFSSCLYANLNGLYPLETTEEYAQGIIWHDFTGYYQSLQSVQIKLRPKY